MPDKADEHKSDIDLLQEVIDLLPDSSAHPDERRKYSLTKDDVLVVFRIAKIASTHKCPFVENEPEILQSVAQSINKTQKIATGIMITGMVSSVIALIWFALKHVAAEWVHNGGKI